MSRLRHLEEIFEVPKKKSCAPPPADLLYGQQGTNHMNKNEQIVQMIREGIVRLRNEQAEFNKATDDKIAALELSYETFTGEKLPKSVLVGKPTVKTEHPRTGRGGRRGMKIDRQAIEKTVAFLQERGDKPTTISMLQRKFNITAGAATQRCLKAQKLGMAERVSTGAYKFAKASGAGGHASKNEGPAQ